MHRSHNNWQEFIYNILGSRVVFVSLLSLLSTPQKVKAHIDDPLAYEKLKFRLAELFLKARNRPIVILCIGTDRSTGDALGPLTGTHLSRLNIPKLNVFGTLDNPIHAANLEEKLKSIFNELDDPYVIAVDACLGRFDSIGCINLSNRPLKPGAGVNKKLPEVGEANLVGIVNVGGFMEYMVLQNTRLNLVWRMSESMSTLIKQSYLRAFFKSAH